MFENISILIINSSHKSIDNITSVLKAKILSKQRPHITCISYEEFNDETNLKSFIEEYVSVKMHECWEMIESVRKMKEFNQLEIWKNEKSKRRTSNRNATQKHMLEKLTNTILDSPNENDFYLILFDVYDSEIIKSIASFELSSLMGVVNIYPRNISGNFEDTVKCENFWNKLLEMKHLKNFENVAFIDLDVPIVSDYILNVRSQLIYDQFCHFFYDFKQLKFLYKHYSEQLVVHEINVKAPDEKEFKQLQKRLDQLPHEILSIEDIYEAIIEQITQDFSTRKSSILLESSLSKFMEIEAFGKTFYDMNDAWRKGYDKNPKFYAHKIFKLEKSWADVWNNIDTQQSIEQKQILNYFMNKIMEHLNRNKKDHGSIELYFYALQFKNWHHMEKYEREFYENRSVGHKKLTNDTKHPRRVTSDACIGYRNTPSFPIELEQLVKNTIKLNEMENFYIQFFSRPAMLQHIDNLNKIYNIFYRRYSKIFDALLINFPSRKVPKIFSSKVYTKTLSTPLCFRDFNDYKKYELSMDNPKSENFSEFSGKGDDQCSINHFEHESFILPMSIKFQQKPFENNDTCTNVLRETIGENRQKPESVVDVKEEVYNVCNRRMEFQIEESEFQLFLLNTKASVFTWLNMKKHLNFVCTLHDKIQLSYSYDLHTNEFNNVTLRDEHTTGMICSIDIGDISQHNNNNNVTLSFPHGMIIKIIDADTVEINWMELIERSHDMSLSNAFDNNVETKRTYFSNGFVMIHMLNDIVKIYSCNGTIFEIVSKKGNGKRKSSTKRDEKLSDIYKFYISSIHFLRKYMSISSFVMTLSSGNRFIVENDWIVEELKPLSDVREYLNEEKGNLYITRSDGLKVLHANTYTKCLYNDGTVITKTYYCNNNDIATIFDGNDTDMRKPISILDEIWLSEAENESKMLMDDLLNFVNDDYFVNINQSCLFEHKKQGSFRFTKNGIEMKLFNGMIVNKQYDKCSIALNGISFQIDDSKIEFYDEKCDECFNNNKVVIQNLINSNDPDEETLISANDIDGNVFEIKRNGRQMFYEKLKPKLCQLCESSKKLHEMKNYGERWIVLNRDMSGYEIFSRDPLYAYSHINSTRKMWMETSDTILVCCPDEFYEIDIDNDFSIDFTIEMDNSHNNENLMSSSSNQSLSESSINSVTRASDVNVNSGINEKRKSQQSTSLNSFEMNPADIDKPLYMTPPWVTVNDSSISSDINCGREMIQFYSNPLLNLPESISVSAFFKLQNKKFTDVIEALCHLRKHSREKFIIDVDGLMKPPVQTRTFQEHFKFIVKRSIEGYVEEKLKLYRESMARAIIEDLLQNAFERLFGGRSSSSCKINTYLSENEKGLHVSKDDDSSFDSICLIPKKSFSFV